MMSSSESQKAGDRIHYVAGEYLPDAKSYVGFAVRKAGEADSEAVLRSINRRLAQYGYAAGRLEHLGEEVYQFWVSTRPTKRLRATEGVGNFSFRITRVTRERVAGSGLRIERSVTLTLHPRNRH